MFNKISALAFSVAFVSPMAATAQDFSGAVTLGYSHTKQSDLDVSLNGATIDGRLNFNLGGGASLGLRYDSFLLNVAGADLDISGNLIGLDVNYDVSEAFSAKVFMDHAEIGGESMGVKLSGLASIKSFGIEGHYKTGALDFGAFYAKNEIGGLVGLLLAGADLSVDTLGLTAKYEPSQDLVVGGTIMRTTLDIGVIPAKADIDYLGVAAAYGISDQFSVFGGLSQTRQSDMGLKLNTIALGGSYDLSDRAGFPLIASLELSRTTLKSSFGGLEPDVDSIRLGITMPLGKGSAKAPLNSTADAILNPSHDVLSQSLLNF